jgi:ribosomal peptide maturation radical SAM protein 1
VELISMRPFVALASMPWAPVQEPSLALGILQAQLKRNSIKSKALYLNTQLLKHVSYETYLDVAGYWGLNEFVFAELLSPGEDAKQLNALAERCAAMKNGSSPAERYATPEALLEMLLRFRGEVALDYLEECADEVLRHEPTMLGLTCMFDQTLASVALARIVKARSPGTMVILGGYALEGAPGDQVLKAFPWIDAVVRGDGEALIGPLAYASVGQVDLSDLPGVQTQTSKGLPPRNIIMNDSPSPDYDDWFGTVDEFRKAEGIRIVTGALPVESSRGCWWGQRHHCVFCGIDDATLKFRFKSPGTMVDTLRSVRDRYGDFPFRFSDYILPNDYFSTLLPELTKVEPRYRLHCEIKANQSRERVVGLAMAGFEEVQPGIESFSSDVLRLMDKGVTSVQNVALLKYGYLERIVIHYNFIYGIPGETSEAYRRMLEVVPRLYHLTPPVSRTEAIVTRFAPMWASGTRTGRSQEPVHHRCYDTLFSESFLAQTGFSLDDYAYYFEPYEAFSEEMSELYAQSVAQINHWKRQHRERRVVLSYSNDDTQLRLMDSRFTTEPICLTLSGAARAVYLACDNAPINEDSMIRDLACRGTYDEGELRTEMQQLDEARLIWRDGKRVFGLAVPEAIAEERISSGWRDRWTAIYK